MADPWRHVDADDDLVADLLAGSVDAVFERGAWLHPEARIVARDGQLRIECPAPDGEPLIRLPRAAFVPIARVRWGAGDEALDIDGLADDVDDRELLVLQAALHNACGKLPWLAATHPVLAADLDDATITAVRAFRPSFRVVRPTAAEVFWSTRAFRLPIDSAAPEPFALPIVDCLNHHHRGATGTWTGEHFTVDIAHADGTDVCLIDYGLHRDAIGMAIVYGFAAHAAIAHSAPITFEANGLGIITVDARGRARNGELLPIEVAPIDGGVRISHVPFGRHGALAEQLIEATGCATSEAEAVVTSIADANVRLTEALRAAAGTCAGSAAGTLHASAAHQADAIRRPADARPITGASGPAVLGEDDIDALAPLDRPHPHR